MNRKGNNADVVNDYRNSIVMTGALIESKTPLKLGYDFNVIEMKHPHPQKGRAKNEWVIVKALKKPFEERLATAKLIFIKHEIQDFPDSTDKFYLKVTGLIDFPEAGKLLKKIVDKETPAAIKPESNVPTVNAEPFLEQRKMLNKAHKTHGLLGVPNRDQSSAGDGFIIYNYFDDTEAQRAKTFFISLGIECKERLEKPANLIFSLSTIGEFISETESTQREFSDDEMYQISDWFLKKNFRKPLNSGKLNPDGTTTAFIISLNAQEFTKFSECMKVLKLAYIQTGATTEGRTIHFIVGERARKLFNENPNISMPDLKKKLAHTVDSSEENSETQKTFKISEMKKENSSTGEIIEVPIDQITVNIYVRKELNEDRAIQFGELYESGAEIAPIELTPAFEVIVGRHRLAGMKLAGLTMARSIIKLPASKAEHLMMAMEENLGGSLPPSKEDIQFTLRQLLEEGLGRKEIMAFLTQKCHYPTDLASLYHRNALSELEKVKLSKGLKMVAEGEKSAKEVAEICGIEVEKLKAAISGKKKLSAVQVGQLAGMKGQISKLFQSTGLTLTILFKKVDAAVEDSSMTLKDAQGIYKHANEFLYHQLRILEDKESRMLSQNGEPAEPK